MIGTQREDSRGRKADKHVSMYVLPFHVALESIMSNGVQRESLVAPVWRNSVYVPPLPSSLDLVHNSNRCTQYLTHDFRDLSPADWPGPVCRCSPRTLDRSQMHDVNKPHRLST
jgi:hypothetical protein